MRKRKEFKRFGQTVCRELDRRDLKLFDLTLMLEQKTEHFCAEYWLRRCFATRCPKWLVDAIKEVLNMENNEGGPYEET